VNGKGERANTPHLGFNFSTLVCYQIFFVLSYLLCFHRAGCIGATQFASDLFAVGWKRDDLKLLLLLLVFLLVLTVFLKFSVLSFNE